jgi:hypothetical protein
MGREGTEFDVRLRQALALLESKGLGRSTRAPPLFRLLWKLGIEVPPPHMAGFAFNSVLMGGFFGVFWSLLMWLMLWGRQGMPLVVAAATALVAGGLFGLTMGWYMRHGARKHAIPRWRDFIRE